LYLFLKSVVDVSEWSASCSGRFKPDIQRKESWNGLRYSGRFRGGKCILTLKGFEHPVSLIT